MRARECAEIAVLGADPGLAVAQDDGDVCAVAAHGRAQAAGGRPVAQDGQARMAAQQRGGRGGPDRPLQGRLERLGLLGPGHDEQQLARGQQRAQPDRQRLARHVLGSAEVGRGRLDGRRVQCHTAHVVAGPRAGLVEGDVRIAPQPQHGEVDRGGVEHGLVARRLGLRVGGGAVERLASADRDPGQLAVEQGAEAARILSAEAEVLVEAEHRHMPAGQRAVGRAVAQGRVEAARRVTGGEQHARARARAHAVGDELGGGQPDVAGVVEDEQRRGRHARSVARGAGASPGAAGGGPRSARPRDPRWRGR
jgi:hypothetical protein